MFGFQVTGVVLSVTGSIRWGEGVSVIFCQGVFFLPVSQMKSTHLQFIFKDFYHHVIAWDFKPWFQMLETIIVSNAIFELLILSALFPILWIHMILSDWFGWFPPGSIGAERIYKHKSLACPDASYPNQCCSVVDLKIFSLKVCYGGDSGMKFVSRVAISIHMLC